jgi:hypothetical protein
MVHDGELGLGVVFDDPARSYKETVRQCGTRSTVLGGEAAWRLGDSGIGA